MRKALNIKISSSSGLRPFASDTETLEWCFANGRRIFDAEEFADAEVGASAVFVIGGKLALCVEANLIEHAPEENDAANFFGGVSEPGDFHKRGDRS